MEVPGVAEHLEQDNVYMALATALDADCTPLVGIQLRVTDTRRVGQEGKTKIAATFAPAL
jgi:hypothetical protein